MPELRQQGACVKRFRSNRGGEFTRAKLTNPLEGREWCVASLHTTPQRNGVAKSLNRRLLERLCAILPRSYLPRTLSGEAIHFSMSLENRTSTQTLGHSSSVTFRSTLENA